VDYKGGGTIGGMREPSLEIDGWCLADGEVHHAAAPETFRLPERKVREALQSGDFAKLIFRIDVDEANESHGVERMWVLVRERTSNGYLGVLDNEPLGIAKNEELWRGTELPFSPQHMIDVEKGDAGSMALAGEAPRKRWPPR
jgi:hypothetical protein